MDIIIAGKAFISLGLCLLAMICLRVANGPLKFDWSPSRLIALFLVLRVGIYIGCFVILKFDAQSDVLVYVDLARRVAAGDVPGATDRVPMHYGPLFLYVIAAVLWLWNDAKAVILFMVACELVSFVIWLRLGGRLVGKIPTVTAAILYACCPLSIFAGVIAGNNDLLAGIFVTFGIALAVANRPAWSGVMLGISVPVSKAITVLSGLPLFLASSSRWIWLVGAALPVIGVYGFWALIPVDILAGFRFHAGHFSSGNIPFALGLIGVDTAVPTVKWTLNLIGASAVLAVAGLPFLQRRSVSNLDAIILIAAANILFLLVSAKSFPHYAAMVLFPITLAMAMCRNQTRILLLYFAYNVSASLESSMWFRWFQNKTPAAINEMIPNGIVQYAAFATMEAVLLASYALMVWIFVRLYLERQSAAATAP